MVVRTDTIMRPPHTLRTALQVLGELKSGRPPASSADGGVLLSDFDHLYSLVGFDRLADLEEQYNRKYE